MKTVSFACDDLRGHVMGSTDDGISSKPSLYFQFFGCSHIDQGEEAIDIHH